jgi:hypothetical protein
LTLPPTSLSLFLFGTPLESANIPTFDPRGRRNHESRQRHRRVGAAVKAAALA